MLPPATAISLSRKVRIIFSTVEKFDVRDFFSCQHWTFGLSPLRGGGRRCSGNQGRSK
ncbi:hypothetical protein IE4771_CH03439 [Rhizobium etli bv. mimosae str. IE4771]|uniref:Uncharacterized protein n=1 Tax=Rhizobium etli bv. mimosae str. IE4771 TaxID=1432050 RepID=A0A060I942_RHIET|nr:hypothetical protein IE4771_CH03439 [Rhizobium sp. IE4771]